MNPFHDVRIPHIAAHIISLPHTGLPSAYAKQFATGGKKKWVRYDEGALLYSMGIHSFMELAKEAKAVYHIKRIVLVNTEKLDEYIEVMYSDDPE